MSAARRPRPRRPRGDATVLVYHPDEADRYAARIEPRRARVRVHVASKPSEAHAVIGDVDVIYGWKVPTSLYRDATRLAWLQAAGAGVDWALVPELGADVVVTRVPKVFGPWMAEYVLGWALWVTQRMSVYLDAQHERRWAGDVLPDRLRGRTLAIVGLGDIGRTVARYARPFGMRILGVSRSGRPVSGVDTVVKIAALERALRQADIVVVTVPLTPATRALIDARALGAMRSTAWLVNVARGPVVDEPALIAALETRRIAGAILDVFDTEPLPAAHPFWRMPNVVVTPHIAGPSTPDEIAPVFNDNLARYLSGRPLRHVVDRSRGY